MPNKTYSEKLNDPRWQKKRLEVMDRDNFMCNTCFSTIKSLHVHHAYYEKGKNPWEYPSEALTTQCESCHEKMETGLLRVRKAIGGHLGYIDCCVRLLIKEGIVWDENLGAKTAQASDYSPLQRDRFWKQYVKVVERKNTPPTD